LFAIKKERLIKFSTKTLISLGLTFLVFLFLAFTDIPFWVRYHLGSYESEVRCEPDYIVMMGAGGMPGPDNLIRAFYTAYAANTYPESNIYVAIASWNPNDKYSPAGRIKEELLQKNIDSNRIFFDTLGINTYEQSKNIFEEINNSESCILIVSSPEHIYRAVKTFEKTGFKKVHGLSSYETDIPEELLKNKKQKGKKGMLGLRYNFWTQLKYEIIVARELIAITYYKITGKI
jgi:uncharacterized SAM-binding protein YcdF (DUF218 family)